MELFNKLKKQLHSYLEEPALKKIESAYLFAESAHREQRRQTGEPYITHPLNVARILADMHMDSGTIIAALLHDVIEDTPIKAAEIEERFGTEVITLVDAVSKLDKLSFKSVIEAQAESFRKMVLAMTKDVRVILIKLADRLHNTYTLTYLSSEKKARIAKETFDIYIPIAYRLGMRKLGIQLENHCFEALYPHRYRILKEAVQQMGKRKKNIIDTIQKAIVLQLKNKIIGAIVMGREKHLYSIYRKMKTKRLALSEVMDMYGFRIVVETLEQCYQALGFIHQLYRPIFERFKDYIAIPKANGYQSLHTCVSGPYGIPIEIQIRTDRMDKTAEEGIAAHWMYKEESLLKDWVEDRAQTWLKNLEDLQQQAGSSLEFIENIKIDLTSEEIYVFTPKGDIFELPLSATAVDFAYAVHSDIGNQCIACKVDRRFVPLSTVLNNGQTIEILTTPRASPHPEWLNFVVTPKAKNQIKQFIKQKQSSEAIYFGKNLLENALHLFNSSLTQLSAKRIQSILMELKIDSIDLLYQQLGKGEASPFLIAQHLVQIPLPASASPEAVSIKGAQGLLFHFSKCCYPIPGDTIVGHFEKNKGIVVHQNRCGKISGPNGNLTEYYFPLQWDEKNQDRFPVEISLLVRNRRGILASILETLAQAEIDVEDIHVLDKSNDYAKDKLIVLVKNKQHLESAFNQILKNKEILEIKRL